MTGNLLFFQIKTSLDRDNLWLSRPKRMEVAKRFVPKEN